MAKIPARARIRLGAESDEGPKQVKVEVKLEESKDVPVMFANQLIMNFFGSEFYLTIVAATPAPWTGQLDPSKPKVRQGRVLGRYQIPMPQWIMSVKSFQEQIDRLTSQGIIGIETTEEKQEGTE